MEIAEQIQHANNQPLVVILTGPSGVGKDAALNELKKMDRPWHYVVTATTRPIRHNEIDGVDYIFMEESEFKLSLDQNEFLESANVYERWYGVPKSQVSEPLKNGLDVILKVDIQGAATIKSLIPQAISIFMIPGTLNDLENRLRTRMTESEEQLKLRLEVAKTELTKLNNFEYYIINEEDNLESTVRQIDTIITAEKQRLNRPHIDIT
ncbi:MAG: guanylate kinase [SAR202 cluster bacterium]|nr:guanylate kinase [SAR202 cluster bacterium]MQG86064.1 guanylate kinase [SAR202 cluster bacterium]|tara:strand:- start:7072 stop:7698 length:627 start_codon:yes stop_codon:yes gene_type:complete